MTSPYEWESTCGFNDDATFAIKIEGFGAGANRYDLSVRYWKLELL